MKLDVDTPRMLFNGLNSQAKGFRDYVSEHENMSIVLTDADATAPQGIKVEEADMSLGAATDIHILPVVEGAGIETALVAAFVSWGASAAVASFAAFVVISVGKMVIMGAIARMMAPSPDTSQGAARPDEKPSFIYNGAVNTVEQGYAVPIVYGIHMTGSIVISAGVSVEEIPYTKLSNPTYDALRGILGIQSPDAVYYQYGGV